MVLQITVDNHSIIFGKPGRGWLVNVQATFLELNGLCEFKMPLSNTNRTRPAYTSFKRRMKLK